MTDTFTLKVGGMSCHHCKAAIEKAVGALQGVSSARVDMATGQVTVTGETLDKAAVVSIIEELGYLVEE